MSDRFNTAAGWTLFAGIVALGLSSVSTKYFHANKAERPETMGYKIEGVAEEGAAAGPSLNTLLATGDAAKGEKVFAKCSSCHTINQGGANGIGPNLYGVVGEAIGKGRGGFAFSPDLAGHDGKWDFANLDKWLSGPKGFAPGTKISFAGLSNPEDRANLIVYLNTQGSDVPLPAADAAPAGDAAAAPAGPEALVAAADPAKGEKVFAKCSSCHTINKGGANGIGPNLFAVMGDKVAAGRGGYAFSDALKSKGGVWDVATMDAWLTSPRAFAPGTKMTFAGLSSAEDRAALIAYLSAQK